ncbi:nucleotidyltransferase AbiEii toxin of type IV toxin-antitoxin system [Kribbella antiqua]|uniref:Nucleotidyltransferase AbiEii toxin of type IV toxin-antitoxin system n=1 Tax=Kribbella antiqua TaxID=2512217 RepID=A0A4R2IHE2_9ACTN|nr:nucleotidyl transferase AbiEii/AbiGii toxin family protein [Kribbella antiqua]TCO44163.1 nucleotidyltransferase AbiEii toxin of type IV toxin-antitoxin system [Kribbella antiqua]
MSKPTRDDPGGRAYLDLQNRARREGRGTQELLTLYVVERWLARLSRSSRLDDFILKGGMLLAAYGRRRPTADADALAQNMPGDERTVAARVAEIASLPDPDGGVEYLLGTVTTSVIRDDALYAGIRVGMTARIATAAVKLRLDVNFGDPVTPGPQIVEVPALRPGVDAIRVLGYPVETLIAEKLSTAVALGAANTRVRDYADIYTLITSRELDDDVVREAVRATAAFRGTAVRPLSEVTSGLVALRSGAYAAYRAGLGLSGHDLPEDFADLVQVVAAFADRVLTE